MRKTNEKAVQDIKAHAEAELAKLQAELKDSRVKAEEEIKKISANVSMFQTTLSLHTKMLDELQKGGKSTAEELKRQIALKEEEQKKAEKANADYALVQAEGQRIRADMADSLMVARRFALISQNHSELVSNMFTEATQKLAEANRCARTVMDAANFVVEYRRKIEDLENEIASRKAQQEGGGLAMVPAVITSALMAVVSSKSAR